MHFDRISCHKHGIYRAAAFSIHPDGVCIAWWTTPVSTIIDPPQVSTSTTQKVRHPILLATHFRSFFLLHLALLLRDNVVLSWTVNYISWRHVVVKTYQHQTNNRERYEKSSTRNNNNNSQQQLINISTDGVVLWIHQFQCSVLF